MVPRKIAMMIPKPKKRGPNSLDGIFQMEKVSRALTSRPLFLVPVELPCFEIISEIGGNPGESIGIIFGHNTWIPVDSMPGTTLWLCQNSY